MGTIIARFTAGVCVCFVVGIGCLFFLAGPVSVAWFFTLWAAVPFVGHGLLAHAMRRSITASTIVLLGTILVGLFTFALFYEDKSMYISARYQGRPPPMNCAGPVRDIGLPILQCVFVVFLGGLALPPWLVRVWHGRRWRARFEEMIVRGSASSGIRQPQKDPTGITHRDEFHNPRME
jgi:hypothetical protein